MPINNHYKLTLVEALLKNIIFCTIKSTPLQDKATSRHVHQTFLRHDLRLVLRDDLR